MKRLKLFLVVAMLGCGIVWLGCAGSDGVKAASATGFDAGYIISDFQMSNYNSMNEAQIQSFLSSKNSCGNRDYNYYLRLSANQKYSWHWANGHFVCLSEERFGGGEVIGSGETAAHIIWQAAQDYRINPQVLIVTLQKESSLVTDQIPNNADYRTAMGYGCPDSSACASSYYGFRNQIRNAAALFRTVLDGGWSNYPIGNNYIRYNPNTNCGGSVVNVRNRATSALYRYTPYQPNKESLAAGYGTAYCGAYGNRNFYLYFLDWFGDPKDEGLKIPQSSYVVEGEYVIRTKLDGNKALDVYGAGVENGTNIQIHSDNGTVAQKWQIKRNSDNTYTLINPNSGKVLDVEGAGITDGINVQLYSSNGTCAQKWQIVRNNDGSYTLYSTCSGRVLDVQNGDIKSGTNVHIFQPNSTNAQKWYFIPSQELADGKYIINSRLANNKVVDVAGAGKTNGTNIQLYNKNGTKAQEWQISFGADGYYTITNPASGKVLDVYGAGVKNGTNVQLYKSNGTCAQKWQIAKNNDKSYTIYSACSGLALDVTGASVANGTNIQIYRANGTMAQKWKFLKWK